MSSAEQTNRDCSGDMEVEPVTFREKRTEDMVKIFLIIILSCNFVYFQRRCRAKKSEEEKEIVRRKDSNAKASKRSKMSEEEKERRRLAEKEKKALKRAAMTEAERKKIRERDRARKAKQSPKKVKNTAPTLDDIRRQGREAQKRRREKRTDAEIEYENIENLLRMRELRKQRNGKEHLLDNLEAKRGMHDFWEHGRLKEFEERNFRDIDEETLWRKFWKRGKDFKDILNNKKPELGLKLAEEAEKARKDLEEKKNKEREREKAGIWFENPQTGEMIWTGENPPPPDEAARYWGGENDEWKLSDGQSQWGSQWVEETEEERKAWEELQMKWYKEMMDDRRKETQAEKNRIQRERYHARKLELQKPIEVPRFEKSEYELIRDKIVKEREDAMKASGWFSD